MDAKMRPLTPHVSTFTPNVRQLPCRWWLLRSGNKPYAGPMAAKPLFMKRKVGNDILTEYAMFYSIANHHRTQQQTRCC
ncbi:hypothetical protein Q1695_010804 [Nippostrongylus brasiliensis]|nr:hypothetical protein Q1695_010804 [Nippostrongylus brasiliensis]